jgi:hypothetical protein
VKASEPLRDVLDVGLSEARITGAQASSEDRVGLSDARQDRVVARPTVVARVRSRQRALLLAEDRRHGRVDVDGERLVPPVANGLEPLLGHERLEVLELRCPEAAKVVVCVCIG